MTSIPGTQKAGAMKTHTHTECPTLRTMPTCSPTKEFSLKDEWRTDLRCNFGCNSTKPLHNKESGRHASFHCLTVCMCVLKWCPYIIRHSSSYWLNNSCSCLDVLCEHPHIFTQTLCWKAVVSHKNTDYP